MRNLIYILSSCLALSSCMLAKPELQELPVPPQPIKHNVFTILPPSEPGWVVANISQYNLSLAQKANAQDETYAIQVMLLKLPDFKNDEEFEKYITQAFESNTSEIRFINIDTTISLIKSNYGNCVKNLSIAEDTQAIKQTNNSNNLILEIINYTCKHPTITNGGANFSYSHRYYSGHKDPELENKADILFSNFKFIL